jgi:hypothetical protein
MREETRDSVVDEKEMRQWIMKFRQNHEILLPHFQRISLTHKTFCWGMGCAQSAPERQQVQPAAAAVKSQQLVPVSASIRPGSPVLVSTMSKPSVNTSLVLGTQSSTLRRATDSELD